MLIPFGTMKNFPFEINHTIFWAKHLFELYFIKYIHECKKLLENGFDS